MSALGTIRSIAGHQKNNLVKALSGRPLVFPSLVSMTLDEDDTRLARDWLLSAERWDDTAVVRAFEAEFARWNGSRFAVAYMAGRAALSACIEALGLRPGDEVIVPGYTCVVVANAFRYAGIGIVYADIELDTYGLSLESVREKVTPTTKALVLQHLYGLVSRDYEAVVNFARERQIRVIEDCAHSTGAEFKTRKVGNLGDLAFYSSEQSKVFCTMQGGVAVTNDPALARRLQESQARAPSPDVDRTRLVLQNLLRSYYENKHPGRWYWKDLAPFQFGKQKLISTTREEISGVRPPHYGQTMAAPVAALACNQLRKLDAYNERRRKTARKWDDWCGAHGRAKPLVIGDSMPIYLRYPVMVEPEQKRETCWAQDQLGVEVGVWFVSQLHPAPQNIPDCPNAARAVERCINFPCLLD